jgi:hypothetical protein
MLDRAGERFLDDVTPGDLARELGCTVLALENPGELVAGKA